MTKPSITGVIQEFHGQKFLPNGAEVITLILAWTFTSENGKYTKEVTTPVNLYGGVPKCLEDFHAKKLGVGDKVYIEYIPSGYKSKSGDFWNSKLDGDLFSLKLVEKAIGFGEAPTGDF
jgi:hypothetical protein